MGEPDFFPSTFVKSVKVNVLEIFGRLMRKYVDFRRVSGIPRNAGKIPIFSILEKTFQNTAKEGFRCRSRRRYRREQTFQSWRNRLRPPPDPPPPRAATNPSQVDGLQASAEARGARRARRRSPRRRGLKEDLLADVAKIQFAKILTEFGKCQRSNFLF